MNRAGKWLFTSLNAVQHCPHTGTKSFETLFQSRKDIRAALQRTPAFPKAFQSGLNRSDGLLKSIPLFDVLGKRVSCSR